VSGVRGSAGGADVTEQARIVIGADGMRSLVARTVQAPEYNTKPTLTFGYYSYWSGIPRSGADIYFADGYGMLAFPTNDGCMCIGVGAGVEGFHEFRKDIEGNYLRTLAQAPEFAPHIPDAKREAPYQGTADQPNFFRKPYGPGWALVGDAGYHRDFITGLGITDALRDAELLADAIDAGFSGRAPLDDALCAYEQRRNEIATPLYEFTTALASMSDPPTPQMMMSFGAAMAQT
jgi:flavin-dependent dehydrogenase